MSLKHSDFNRLVRIEDRIFGSLGSAPYTDSESALNDTPMRRQLSLVPDPIEVGPALPPMLTPEDDLWQEKALCAQTDPEAFFPEKGGSTREAKRICQGCEVRDACLDYALAHDERFGIWGGLSERERRRLKRGII
jgi:WhiB family redox-sensing transcriptional regulator